MCTEMLVIFLMTQCYQKYFGNILILLFSAAQTLYRFTDIFLQHWCHQHVHVVHKHWCLSRSRTLMSIKNTFFTHTGAFTNTSLTQLSTFNTHAHTQSLAHNSQALCHTSPESFLKRTAIVKTYTRGFAKNLDLCICSILN